MIPVSIVIITKNEAELIERCLLKCSLITDDIVVVDSGSSDGTLDIARVYGCRVFKENWYGYGANKNKGIDAAKYSWILSIDADEVPDDELIASLHKLHYADQAIVYDIKFKSYFGGKPINFGSWGRDHHIRLFSRESVRWSETMVHEKLLVPGYAKKKKLKGHLHHYSVSDVYEYENKGSYYASLSAKQYFHAGKRTSAVKLYISPVFGFFKSYIWHLGFLDGREGWEIAKTTTKTTRRKYHFLMQLTDRHNKKQPVNDSFAVEY